MKRIWGFIMDLINKFIHLFANHSATDDSRVTITQPYEVRKYISPKRSKNIHSGKMMLFGRRVYIHPSWSKGR